MIIPFQMQHWKKRKTTKLAMEEVGKLILVFNKYLLSTYSTRY